MKDYVISLSLSNTSNIHQKSIKHTFDKVTKEVTKDNKLFEDNHLKLPFLLDITNKLKYYGLVEKDVKDMESLVDELWK